MNVTIEQAGLLVELAEENGFGQSVADVKNQLDSDSPDDYDTLRTANQRLEGEVARLTRKNELLFRAIDRINALWRKRLAKAALSTANGEVTE